MHMFGSQPNMYIYLFQFLAGKGLESLLPTTSSIPYSSWTEDEKVATLTLQIHPKFSPKDDEINLIKLNQIVPYNILKLFSPRPVRDRDTMFLYPAFVKKPSEICEIETH